jgi:hypothetical protein
MGMEDELLALIDLIYEAAFDSIVWPLALTKLADMMGMAQVGLLTLDRRACTFDSIAPRADPVMDALFKKYWAFHNPLWPRTIARPPGEIFTVDSLVPRRDLTATPFFNEWMRPAEFGAAAMGVNLRTANGVSTMLSVGHAPGKDEITLEQMRVFKAATRHVNRAIHIHHELRLRDLDHDTAPDRLEELPRGIMLVDGAARVQFANAAARALLGSGDGLALEHGCLRSTDNRDALLQGLILYCKREARSPIGPGGGISIRVGSRRSLRVKVTPLRAKGGVAELPWLGLNIPVAIVTIATASIEKCLN